MVSKNILGYIDKITPMVTEKALAASEASYIVFKAPKNASTEIVTSVIEYLYKDTKVLKINSSLIKGKVKRFRGRIGRRADFKKFYVKLDKVIDITAGIK